LIGKVKVEYVCREDINMHFTQEIPYSNKADQPEDEEKVIDFILGQVAKAGDKVQSTLVDQQGTYYGEHFKRIRRQLPITRTKMDW
jgi:hypothetical protein